MAFEQHEAGPMIESFSGVAPTPLQGVHVKIASGEQ
jgi:hypothetical protein